MPIKINTSKSRINEYLKQKTEEMTRVCVNNLCYVGESVIKTVRQQTSAEDYKNQTGNLRSSVGYIVVLNGRVVQSAGFEKVKNGGEGTKAGETYARDLAKQFDKGLVLLVVAGMNYASYVSAKGYDVLDSAELLARRLVPKMTTELGL